jgi:hypothetical protein
MFAALKFLIGNLKIGVVAQLGERMTGSHEVRGSIPLDSINKIGHSNECLFLWVSM